MASKDLKPDDHSGWLVPAQAQALIDSAFALKDQVKARLVLLGRLRGGKIMAIAETTSYKGDVDTNQQAEKQRLDPDDWEKVSEFDNIFWRTGELTYANKVEHPRGRGYSSMETVTVRHFNVRFEPSAVGKVVANAPEKAGDPPRVQQPNAIQPSKGGRPPKDWWQDFWIEMCRLIYEGDIAPSMTQADIERLMLQWVSDHDKKAGETVIKEAARKLKNALKD